MVQPITTVVMRETVEIQLTDGRVFSGPRGATIETFLKALPEWEESPIVGAIINGELRELTFPITMESRVQPVTIALAVDTSQQFAAE